MTGESETAFHFLNWSRSEPPFDAAACDRIVELGQAFAAEAAKTEDGKVADHRQAYVHRIGLTAASRPLHRVLEQRAQCLNEEVYGLELDGLIAPDYVEYHAGYGHFGWHNDYAYVSAERVRKLTLIVQLSEPVEYEGGALEVFESGPVPLPRDRGTVVAFPAFLPHRVTPVTRGQRRSLVIWLTGPPIR